ERETHDLGTRPPPPDPREQRLDDRGVAEVTQPARAHERDTHRVHDARVTHRCREVRRSCGSRVVVRSRYTARGAKQMRMCKLSLIVAGTVVLAGCGCSGPRGVTQPPGDAISEGTLPPPGDAGPALGPLRVDPQNRRYFTAGG